MRFSAMRIRSRQIVALSAYAAVLMVAAAGTADAVQTLIVRPDSPGTIVTNRAASPELAWDDDGSTRATVTAWFNMSPFSGVSRSVGSDLGTIVGVTLAVDGASTPAFNDDRVGTRWVASDSETGVWHLLPTNGTRDTTFFNVTAERTWSWADFGTLELVVAHGAQGFPDGFYYLYEIALVISYIPVVSVEVTDSTFPFGTLPLDNWATPQRTRIINDGTGVEDFNGRLSVFTAAPHTWSLDPATNGPDTVRAQWSTAGAGGPWNDIAAYDTDFLIQTGIAPSDTVSFWLRILTPTSTGSYDEHSSTLTVSAVES